MRYFDFTALESALLTCGRVWLCSSVLRPAVSRSAYQIRKLGMIEYLERITTGSVKMPGVGLTSRVECSESALLCP